MNNVKLWLLYNNTWNHLIVCKKTAQVHLKMLSSKYVNKSYIFDTSIYVLKGFGIK